MHANAHEIERLQNLIACAGANAEAYREAASDAAGQRTAASLEHRAQERAAVVAHLRHYLHEAGADATVPSSAPPWPTEPIARAEPPTDIEMVEAAGRDEAELQAAFEAVLDDDTLSAPAREAVLKAYIAVRTGGDQMRDLRRALRAGA
ncbi:MAG TPA: PA2169 family four-helix-bundle protein [Dyella sp.]|nr:PA2169 family four-helix-bundle protein [Dyella sp.]